VDELTEKQREVLETIRKYRSERGVSPSLGDLAGQLGISRATVHQHVHVLLRKRYIDFQEGVGRSWLPMAEVGGRGTRRIPVVGRVAAGTPILAEQNIEGWITVDGAKPADTLFALRVEGDSMVDGGILPGDLVVVRKQETADNGDIVVARIGDDEATVKKLQRAHTHVVLLPMNCRYEPIVAPGDHVHIEGKVVGVRRSMEED
jgi:repressor LexA